MYSSFYNHFINFSHFIVAFIIIFMVYPKIIFKNKSDSIFEYIISNYIRIVLLFIILGYILVILKIFEFIGIFVVLAFIWFYAKFIRPSHNHLEKIISSVNVFIYDYVDGFLNKKHLFRKYLKKKKDSFIKCLCDVFKDRTSIVNITMLFVTLGYSAYLRFYDALIHAAPAMSDPYVTLAWMKYINKRVLFHDGIYPQGFHIYLATIQKFSFIDPLYVLKYAGPFNGVLITLGLYFVASRLTNKMTPGIIAAFIYGVMGFFLSGEWMRQAATNSQEFGFIFVFPTLYFFYKYLKEEKKDYLITAFCGTAVCGLVHTIAFLFVAFGAVVIILSSLLINFKKSLKPCLNICLIGTITGIISIIPAIVGLLMGKQFHGSSTNYLMEFNANLALPKLSNLDYGALACTFLIFIYIFLSREKFRTKLNQVFMFLFSSFAFVLYYLGGYVTKRAFIATRFQDLWSLLVPMVIGIGFYIALRIFCKLKIYATIQCLFCVVIIAGSIYYLNPKPIMPYKMEYDSNVEQYLRITKEVRATQWMIVSQDEGYAMVLGTGFHMLVQDFLKDYDPASDKLKNKETNEILKTQDIFIYFEKNIFTTDFDSMKLIYETRKLEKPMLNTWIKKYKETHKNLTTFYEDENIIIYRIHQEMTVDEKEKQIWGE